MPVIELASRKIFGAEELAELGEATSAFDSVYVVGLACRPRNPEIAMQLVSGMRLDGMTAMHRLMRMASLDFSVDGSMHVALLDHVSPRESLWAELAADRLAYISTAFILRWIASRWANENTRAEASVNAAAGKVCEWLQANRLFRGASRDTIKRHWRDYKSVSHIWAAWQILGQAGIDHSTPTGFRQFIETARWLLDRGAEIVPVRARPGDAILSKADAWLMPAEMAPLPAAVVWTDDLDAHDIRKCPAPEVAKPTGAKQRR